MSLPITAIRPPVSIGSINLPAGQSSSGAGGGSFQSLLSNAIGQVQNAQQTADTSAEKFLSGENQEVHQVALAATQNELAFDMFMSVRNKIVSAYQEVMKMQM